MESKRICNPAVKAIARAFNRTSMESKRNIAPQGITWDGTFNRTSMESKLLLLSYQKVRTWLLIEPVWNRNCSTRW